MALLANESVLCVGGGTAVAKESFDERSKWHGGPKFWAFVASISVHLLLLTVFGAVKFSQSRVRSLEGAVPTGRISRLKKYMCVVPRIPKPKVKGVSVEPFAASGGVLFSASEVFESPKPGSGSRILARSGVSRKGLVSEGSGGISKSVEFFGSMVEERKVCYVVDCSGSMKGVFGRVGRRLKESIENLEADVYFHIIFFGDGQLFEYGGGGLVRATKDAKSGACSFVDSIQPVGQTNALTAVEKALEVRDGQGCRASVIYFLTDGFELSAQDGYRLSRRIADLRRRTARGTRINTIGFWPQAIDRKVLETIASESGGEFFVVSGGDG